MSKHVYRAVTTVGAAQIISHAGAYYLPAVIATQASQDLGISRVTIYAGLSLALAVSGVFGPQAGKLVDRFGGRPVLMVSNLLLAAGLSLLALSQEVLLFLLAYVIIGLGMATGMFEVAFAAIVHLFGKSSRNALTGVTLVAGFASVAGWTLSVFFEARDGWRGACWFWAALNIVLALPLNALIPKASLAPSAQQDSAAQPVATTPVSQSSESATPPKYAAALLAFVFAASSFISMGLMSHLPSLLQGFGVSLAAAFSIGALVGPAQISGRILDFVFLRRVHPLVGTRIAALAHPLGVGVLTLLGAPFAALFVILHGLGNGILIISRGTLPLALFGAQGYGQRQGWLNMPAKFCQAVSPFIFGLLIGEWGAGILWLTGGLALSIFISLCLISAKPHSAKKE